MIWLVDELSPPFELVLDLLFQDPRTEKKALPAAQSLFTAGRMMMQLRLLEKHHLKRISDLVIPDWNLLESIRKCCSEKLFDHPSLEVDPRICNSAL
jgi:hypothetical protein